MRETAYLSRVQIGNQAFTLHEAIERMKNMSNQRMVMALNDPFAAYTDVGSEVNSWVNPEGVALLLLTRTKGKPQVLRHFRTKMIVNKEEDYKPKEGEKYIDFFKCKEGEDYVDFALFEVLNVP